MGPFIIGCEVLRNSLCSEMTLKQTVVRGLHRMTSSERRGYPIGQIDHVTFSPISLTPQQTTETKETDICTHKIPPTG